MKKYLSILFALVLVLSLSLVTAVPVAADGTYLGTPPTIDGDLSEWEAAGTQYIYADGCLGGEQIGTGKLYIAFDDDNFYLAYKLEDAGPGDDYLYAFSGGFWFPDASAYNSSAPQPSEWVLNNTTLELRQSWSGVRGAGAVYGEWYIEIVSNNAARIIRFGSMQATTGDVTNLNFYAGSYDGEDPFPGSYITNGVDKDNWIMTGFSAFDSYFGQYSVAAPITTVPLCAGQNIDVGTVTVWDDGTDLYIEYETTGGWLMTETHLEVVTDQNAFPTTKKGNPKVGHFTYSEEHDPPVTEYTEVISLDSETDFYIAAHAVVQKVNVITEAPYYASTVVDSDQGLRKDSTPVRWQRSTPEQGLAFETGKDEFNFFSLGFDGWIIVEFDCPIRNGEGDDVQIIEDTWGSYPLETADVYASQDGSTWFPIGEADNTNYVGIHTISEFDLDDLPWAKYIKIVDTTNREVHGANADGYDLNAVVSLQDCIEIQEETAWGDGCEGERFVEPGNWATYFTYQVQEEITLTGDWLLSVNSGTYLHDMFIISQSPTGELNGNGGYPSSGPPYNTGYDWTLTGQLTGTSVTFTIVYTNSYTATMTGTVATDFNSMNGGAGTGGVTNWTATRVP